MGLKGDRLTSLNYFCRSFEALARPLLSLMIIMIIITFIIITITFFPPSSSLFVFIKEKKRMEDVQFGIRTIKGETLARDLSSPPTRENKEKINKKRLTKGIVKK